MSSLDAVQCHLLDRPAVHLVDPRHLFFWTGHQNDTVSLQGLVLAALLPKNILFVDHLPKRQLS